MLRAQRCILKYSRSVHWPQKKTKRGSWGGQWSVFAHLELYSELKSSELKSRELGVGHKCHFWPCGPTLGSEIGLCGVIRAGFFFKPVWNNFPGRRGRIALQRQKRLNAMKNASVPGELIAQEVRFTWPCGTAAARPTTTCGGRPQHTMWRTRGAPVA